MLNISTIRSLLYVPGNRLELMDKAFATQADAVIIDLEDAVPPSEKARARASVVKFLGVPHPKPVVVRINPTDSEEGFEDLHALHGTHLSAVRIPKCADPGEVRGFGDHLWGEVGMLVTVESARGYLIVEQIAHAHPRIIAIGLGEGDLRSELGMSEDYQFDAARFRLVIASHAAGLGPPMMSVYARPHDDEGLRRDTLAGKGMGFFGRSAIHPRQVPIINEIFTPSQTEIDDARAMLDAFEKNDAAGRGAFVLPDGRFVDEAIAKAARTTIARAKSWGLA